MKKENLSQLSLKRAAPSESLPLSIQLYIFIRIPNVNFQIHFLFSFAPILIQSKQDSHPSPKLNALYDSSYSFLRTKCPLFARDAFSESRKKSESLGKLSP